jgi:hypothetical protein
MSLGVFLWLPVVLLILAFRALCTVRPAPTPDYLVEKKPAPCRGYRFYF